MMGRGLNGVDQGKVLRRVVPFSEFGTKMIRIPKSIYLEMIEHAKKESPLECCGILGGKDYTVEKAFELQNAEKS